MTVPRSNVVSLGTLPDTTGFYWDWGTDEGEAAPFGVRFLAYMAAQGVPPPMLTGGFPLASWSVDEAQADASRYPHTCPRCSGPAYVGAVEVDCAGNCK